MTLSTGMASPKDIKRRRGHPGNTLDHHVAISPRDDALRRHGEPEERGHPVK